MRWEDLREEEFEDAIAASKGLCVLPLGCLEKHGQHLPVGTDGLIIEGCLERLEERHPDWIIMPMFYYGSSSYAVSGPETGTVHVDSMAVCRMAEELFTSLLQAGFKNIHGFAFHQTENFAAVSR